jgi:hypothetical protein
VSFLRILLVLVTAFAASGESLPFQNGERLRYEVAWPSGLGLGEAEFLAQAGANGWDFELTLGASLPTIEINDSYRSATDLELCSQEFEKNSRHGKKSTKETLVFDQEANTVKRSTITPAGPGGTSAVEVPPCAKDALAFLYFLRQNLAMGRIPPPDDLYFGAGYLVSLTFAETLSLSTARGNQETEKILVDLSGPKSQHSFEIFFAKDAARTPLLVRVPFDVGTFSLKLLE